MSLRSALSLSRRPATAFAGLGMFWGAFAATIPDIKARLSVSDAEFGLLLLGSAVGLALAMWMAPRVDRWLGSRGMQVCLGLLAVTWLVPGAVASPYVFAVALVGVGAASGTLDIIMNARVGELEAQTSQPLMNANHGLFSLSYACAALLAGAAREAEVAPVILFAALGCVALVLVPFVRVDVAPVQTPPEGRGRFPLIPVLICGGIVMLAFMSEATVESWSALHIERTLGGGAAEGAFGPAILGFTMALGRFSGQVITERISEGPVIMIATLMAVSGAVIASVAPQPTIAYLGFGILGLGVSVIGPLGLALIGKMVPAHRRTDALSRVAMMGFAGFFIAPTLMGLTSQAFGLRWAFAAVGLVLIVILPLTLLAVRRGRSTALAI